MELYDQIRKISLAFFVTLGLAHLITGMLFINGYYLPHSGLANRVLFIPMLLALFSYLYSGKKYEQLSNKESGSGVAIGYLVVGILLIIGMVALEILLPDAQTPLLGAAGGSAL